MAAAAAYDTIRAVPSPRFSLEEPTTQIRDSRQGIRHLVRPAAPATLRPARRTAAPQRDARSSIRRHCDGPTLLRAFRSAVAHLEAHVDQVNALNVFPVPDGDTGSNMLATVRAALAEAERLPVGERRLDRVAEALSLGALMGARGNSGLILSQVLRGMAEVARDKHRADGVDLGRALRLGAEAAYAAVGHPVEGTILTVAREAADAAADAGANERHVETVLVTAVDGAERSVARTPLLLPALREAGVVDSGGHGLFLLLRGLLMDLAVDADAPAQIMPQPDLAALLSLAEHDGHGSGYGYETMFVLRANGTPLDPAAIRMQLEEIGESVMVAGDQRLANIHVHNEHPDAVIACGIRHGSLSQISIENLDDQAKARAANAALEAIHPQRAPVAAAASSAATTDVAVVAVAQGDGLARTFKAAGAAAIVHGGATANPSTEELLAGIRDTGAANVILLANHKNVVLVARQAAELATGHAVSVIETRNAAEGIGALLALDPRGDLDANTAGMRAAVARMQTLQVTRAVRDARMSGRSVRQGEVLVLDPDEGLVASGEDRVSATLQGLETLAEGFELISLYTGLGVDEAEAEELRERIMERFPGVEIEILDGGQPNYAYLIAAE